MSFPMYVVRMPELLRMNAAKPHDVLRGEGVLQQYAPTMGAAVFVSHQWCSRLHPDPDFEQLPVLQRAMRRLESGTLQIEVDVKSLILFRTRPTVKLRDLRPLCSGCVWYDYFSVPQPAAGSRLSSAVQDDMAQAVSSIPAYVEACEFFIVLAPPVPHADFPERILDYHSWKDRGWCRLERACRTLSLKHTHVLLAWREDTVFQVGAEEYLLDPVGEGTFTLADDRCKITPVMVALMQNKLQALLEKGDLHNYRRMLSARGTILRSLPGVSPHDVFAPGFRIQAPPRHATAEQLAEAFLRLYGFRSACARADGGIDPAIFAGWNADVATMEALLDCRADLHAVEPADDPDFMIPRKLTALHGASFVNADPAVLRLLVRRRAAVNARHAGEVTPLMAAAFGGRAENVAALLELEAAVESKRPLGLTALHMAAMRGRAGICDQLIKARATVAPTSEGLGPVFVAALIGGGRPTMEALLAAPDADFETPMRPQWLSPLGVLVATLSLPSRLWGSRKVFAVVASEVQGMTPLMIAAMMGHIGEAQALIEAGADPFARNARGHTAAQLAELTGLLPKNVAYLRDPASAEMAASLRSLNSVFMMASGSGAVVALDSVELLG